MKNDLKITNKKPIRMTAKSSGRLDPILEKAIEFAKQYECEVLLEFNGSTHTVNQFTEINQAIKYWFNPKSK